MQQHLVSPVPSQLIVGKDREEPLVLTLRSRGRETYDEQVIVMQPCSPQNSLLLSQDLREVEVALLQLQEVTSDISEFLGIQGEQLDVAATSVTQAEESIQVATSTLERVAALEASTNSKLYPALIGIGVGTVIAGPIGFLLSANAGVGLLCLAAGGGIGGIGTSYLMSKLPSLSLWTS